ncbi:MAG: DUF6345 domain-containing protein [Thermoanaerobaculia bacterium]|nr:DUF6345 domain-containing protein [Acidobacteriota bacterium]
MYLPIGRIACPKKPEEGGRIEEARKRPESQSQEVTMRTVTMEIRAAILATVLLALSAPAALSQTRYSTGAVANYPANPCGGPSLPLTIPEASNFRGWYSLANLPLVTRWENNDVWGSDFRDGATADREPSGGSDLPDVYFFTGHGICQAAPAATSPDFLVTCSTNGTPDATNIGTSSRWGNAGGNLKFAFLDASCPMDLVSLGNNWLNPFQGLHIATGHSGDKTHDTLDSSTRGGQFAGYTVGYKVHVVFFDIEIFPELSAGSAWMTTGLIDVQPSVCAVVIANDTTLQVAGNRRDSEKVKSPWARPSGNWWAWRWVCN